MKPKCQKCKGSGESEYSHDEPCPRCGGSGREPAEKCGACNGRGTALATVAEVQAARSIGMLPELKPCGPCEGTGFLIKERE